MASLVPAFQGHAVAKRKLTPTFLLARAKRQATMLKCGLEEYLVLKGMGYRVCRGPKGLGPLHWVRDKLDPRSCPRCDACLLGKRLKLGLSTVPILHIKSLPPVTVPCSFCAVREAKNNCNFCGASNLCFTCSRNHVCVQSDNGILSLGRTRAANLMLKDERGKFVSRYRSERRRMERKRAT